MSGGGAFVEHFRHPWSFWTLLYILGSLNLAPSQSAGGLRKTCGHQNVGSLIPNSEAAGGELVSVGLRHHAAL